MNTKRTILILSFIAVFVVGGILPTGAQTALKDIQGNWAEKHIEALVSRGVVNGYPDHTFRPDRPVTRGEFAKMMVSAFTVTPERETSFKDIGSHWAKGPILELADSGVVEGYPDGTFRPDNKITRAEVVSMLVRVLKLADVEGFATSQSFRDVSKNHWAYANIETALRLKMLPPYLRGEFGPAQPANRAETAAMIDEALKLQIARGTLDYMNTDSRVLGVKTDGGVSDFALTSDTVIFRNTTVAPFSHLQVGDAVYVVLDRYASPQFVKANGVITQGDVASKVKEVTRGLLSPNDLKAIIRGDWTSLTDSLKSTIYDQLVARGATPVEAGAIMNQDWASLKVLGKERLAQVIGTQLGITTDLATALLNQNWEKAKSLAQVEAVEQLLGQFLIDNQA